MHQPNLREGQERRKINELQLVAACTRESRLKLEVVYGEKMYKTKTEQTRVGMKNGSIRGC